MQDDISLTYAWGMILLVSGGVFTAIFAVVWVLVANRARLASRLSSVEGVLLEADVSRGEIDRPGTRLKTAMYLPVGKYTYTVGGKSLTGTTVSLQVHGYRDEAAARAVFAGKRAGEKVTVWYDPSDPSRSSLSNVPPPKGGWYSRGTIIAAVVAAIGLVLVLTG